MKKLKFVKALPIALLTPLASFTSLTSCGIFSRASWKWLESSKNNTEINYCLLIGQNDHSDSIERTRYTRDALGTYDKEATEKVQGNANVAEPKEGHVTVGSHTFKVKELEHMEQKSMAGATWDPITANGSATTWIAKHGSKITFFVSNNDSMAEGAYWASNWIKGLPIFGYDANPSTIKMINSGYITGTVDQNASTQCGASMMMLRNCIDDLENEPNEYKKEEYDPRGHGFIMKSVYDQLSPSTKESMFPCGYVDDELITTERDTPAWKQGRSILAASTAITNHNVKDYLKDNGEAKTPKDMFDQLTKIKKPNPAKESKKILMTYNNKAEVYLVSTLKPYFNEYASRLSLELDVLEGDGTGEGVVINQIKAKEGQQFNGFLINMTYTTSANTYIEELAKIASGGKAPAGGWENYSDRLDQPVIFWNRQPQTTKDGKTVVDSDIMNNKYFKHTYFVGVDAPAGGKVQGQMIKDKILEWYKGSI